MTGVSVDRVDRTPSSTIPFVVAHRAGNQLPPPRVDGVVVEADVRLHHDRVEVRHAKSAWPLPLLWDHGLHVRPAWGHRLGLEALIRDTDPRVELMLDLKGPWRRLAELVRLGIAPHVAERRFTVCARSWSLLGAFDGLPVRRVHSVGSLRQLHALARRSAGKRLEAIAIHEALVDHGTGRMLGRLAEQVLAWPVNDPARARQLLGLGVLGLISDRPDAILASISGGAAAA